MSRGQNYGRLRLDPAFHGNVVFKVFVGKRYGAAKNDAP